MMACWSDGAAEVQDAACWTLLQSVASRESVFLITDLNGSQCMCSGKHRSQQQTDVCMAGEVGS